MGGSNEPDIIGSCMGGEFGECLSPDCCWGTGDDGKPKVATGVGFWAFEGCEGDQPLPTMWEDPLCVDSVMGAWKQIAQSAKPSIVAVRSTSASTSTAMTVSRLRLVATLASRPAWMRPKM